MNLFIAFTRCETINPIYYNSSDVFDIYDTLNNFQLLMCSNRKTLNKLELNQVDKDKMTFALFELFHESKLEIIESASCLIALGITTDDVESYYNKLKEFYPSGEKLIKTFKIVANAQMLVDYIGGKNNPDQLDVMETALGEIKQGLGGMEVVTQTSNVSHKPPLQQVHKGANHSKEM